MKLTAVGREAAALADRILAERTAALVALARADLTVLDAMLARLVPATARSSAPGGD